MRVLGDRVLVLKAKMPEKFHGIILADSTKQDGKVSFNVGKVLDFGPGVKTWNGEFIPGYAGKVGDYVVWEQFGEFECGEVLGKGKWVLRNEDIIVVLDEEEVKDWEFTEAKREVDNEDVDRVVETIKKKNCQCENKNCKASYKVIEVSIKSINDELPQCEYCGERLTGVIEGAPMFDAKLTPKFHQ